MGTTYDIKVADAMTDDAANLIARSIEEALQEVDNTMSTYKPDSEISRLNTAPAGVPVATVAIGNARNAGLLAVRILAAGDPELTASMLEFQEELRAAARAKGAAVRSHRRG